MSTPGPFLYDDGPEALHTGTGRRRHGLIVAILLGTVLVAVGMVFAMLAVRGTPEEQAEEVAGVFLAALGQGDTETAHGLLCDDERRQRAPEDLPGAYLGEPPGEITAVTEVDGEAVLRAEVRWADGATSTWTLVPQDGPKVCGVG